MPPLSSSTSGDSLPPFAFTGRKLGTAVLAYIGVVIGVITLEPFAFQRPTSIVLTWWDNAFDPIANVALFLPVGFLFALTRSATGAADRRRLLLHATLLGFVASTAIEITQIFEPMRYPSPTDVATNTLGATLGAWLFLRASRRLGADGPLVGRMALELPLMGLVYILVPLCSLAALTVHGAPDVAGMRVPLPRGWALVALGLFGGTLLGHVQRRQLMPSRALGPAVRPALAPSIAAAWFAIGALPALATAPLAFVAGAVAAAGAAWLHVREPDDARPINRRFEPDALRRATPWLVAYLALLPLTDATSHPANLAKLDLLRIVESLSAFTVLGYVLAEAWGRLELRYRFTAWRVGLVALGAAIVSETLRGMHAPRLRVAPQIASYVVAAAYGGWIYHLQRAHVRALVAARRDRDAVAAPATQEPVRRTA